MALIECDECGRQVSSRAKVCPHCGADVRPPRSIKKMLEWIVVVVVLVVVIGGASVASRRAGQGPTPQAPPNQAAQLSAVVIDVRLSPFNGTSKVLVDWRNTGSGTIRAVYARIAAYDDKDREVFIVPEYCVYATSDGVPPERAHFANPEREGFVLPANVRATRAAVTITRVDDRGI